jgi:hypothetical protein
MTKHGGKSYSISVLHSDIRIPSRLRDLQYKELCELVDFD